MRESFTLDNGTRVQLVPFEGTSAVSAFVLFKVGSRYERPDTNGAAHFVEHLMFKGTERRPTTLDISQLLDAHGAEYNAFTGKDYTGYYVKIGAPQAELAVDLLHDMLFHSKYESEEVDRERGVIIEEINMYTDNPIMHVEELLEEQMYDGNTLGWNIAGTHETMRGMTREDVIAFRDMYYVPSNMVVVLAGAVPENAREMLEKTFGRVPASEKQPEGFDPFAHPASRERRANVQTKDTQQIQMMLGFPGYEMTDDKLPAAKLLSIILGGSMSSRLFVQVRERNGLAYMVRAQHEAHEDTGLMAIQAGLDASRLPLATKTIREELRKVREEKVDGEELKMAKDHLYGKMLLRLEDSSDYADFTAKQALFMPEVKDLDAWMEPYRAVSQEDILQVAREVLDEARMGVSAVGPYQDGGEFLAKAELGDA